MQMPQRSILGLLVGAFVGVCTVAWFLSGGLIAKTVTGPTAPSGIVVALKVADAVSWNPGSDYYADVRLERAEPYATFLWSDPRGQQSSEGVAKLRASMRWISSDALEFDTNDRKTVRISISGDFWNLEERRVSDPASAPMALDASQATAFVQLGDTFAADIAEAERKAEEFRRREGIPAGNHVARTPRDFDLRIEPTQMGQLVMFSLSDPQVRDGDLYYLLRADNSIERVSREQARELIDQP